MKRSLALLVCILLMITLCGCANINDMKKNLEKAGYEITEMSESKIASLNSDMVYTYNGKGTIISGCYGTDKKGNNVFMVELTDRDDVTILYRELKSQLDNGQIIDIKGKVIVYGYADGVKQAIK